MDRWYYPHMFEEFSNIPGGDPARQPSTGEATLPASPVRDLIREVQKLQAGDQDADNLIRIAAKLAEGPAETSADEVALNIINTVENRRRPLSPHMVSAIIEVTREFGEYEECHGAAETLCRYAVRQANVLGDSCLLLTASLELGELCLWGGRPSEAQYHLKQGLELLERNFYSHPRLALRPLAILMDCHLQLGEVEEARECGERISGLLGRTAEVDRAFIDARMAQARLAQYEGNGIDALGSYEMLLRSMDQRKAAFPYERAEILFECAEILHSSGRYGEAENRLRGALSQLLDRQPCGGENLLSDIFRSLEDSLMAQGKFSELEDIRRLVELYGAGDDEMVG